MNSEISAEDFSSPNFDVKDWINTILCDSTRLKSTPFPIKTHNSDSILSSPVPSEGGPPIDLYVSNLLQTLQLLSQDLSRKLEQTSAESLKQLQRTQQHDLPIFKQSVVATQQYLNSLRDPNAAQNKTSKAFRDLERLDSVHSKVQEKLARLKESENWLSFSGDVDILLKDRKFEAAADRIEEAGRSLMLLDVSDVEDKKRGLKEAKDRMEIELCPILKEVASNYETLETEKLFSLFESIGRMEKFLDVFSEVKCQPMLAFWSEYDSIVIQNGSEFENWLDQFYDLFLAVLTKELNWCSNSNFTFTNQVGVRIVLGVFQSLDPKLSARLEITCSKKDGLLGLIRAYLATHEFASKIQVLIRYNNQDLFAETTMLLYQPFVQFQVNYYEHEKNHLFKTIKTLPSKNEGVLEVAALLNEGLNKLLNSADSSVARCLQFTKGFGSVGLINALIDYFSDIVGNYSELLKSTNSSEYSRQATVSLDGLENLESSKFQIGLRILGVASKISSKLLTLENDIKTMLQETSKSVYFQSLNTDPQIAILQVSTLNSLKLKTLIDSSPDINFLVLTKIHPILDKFTSQSQKFVFDTLFAHISLRLSQFHQINWSNLASATTTSPFNIAIPQFSLSPQSYITSIGEHLLTLPQQLDIYVDDPGLKFSLITIPYLVDNMSRLTNEEKEEVQLVIASDDVPYIWLRALANATMSVFVDRVLELKEISTIGCNQLATDI
ncbi:Golgi transport complex subunit 7, partial [Nowakowskiella sp. JEL0078]